MPARLKRWVYASTHPYETFAKLDASTLRKAFLGTLLAFWSLCCFVFGLLMELYR